MVLPAYLPVDSLYREADMARYVPTTLLRLLPALAAPWNLVPRFRGAAPACTDAMNSLHALTRGNDRVKTAKLRALCDHVATCQGCWKRFEREREGDLGN